MQCIFLNGSSIVSKFDSGADYNLELCPSGLRYRFAKPASFIRDSDGSNPSGSVFWLIRITVSSLGFHPSKTGSTPVSTFSGSLA